VRADKAVAAGAVADFAYEGVSAHVIATTLGVPAAFVFATVGSTMDEAHALGGAGAAAGTLILADRQTRGRGRKGNNWRSPAGAGIWLTILERPGDQTALEVLSLRVGLHVARALERFCRDAISVKWPNDLRAAGKKLGGILVETRWRGPEPDWAAIGLGVNVTTPDDVPGAVGLREGTRRLDVLAAVVPALREAAARRGPLDPDELREFAARDCARGRRCSQPSVGIVRGITPAGELVVEGLDGIRRHRAGSLVLEGTP
jgi:BirA family biotin operon repressor/biotin-[acetyl-CoA-carboxylase] ligase